MQPVGNRKVIAITGTVWTWRKTAPRRLLVKDGFAQPTWFTTSRPINDADYQRITRGRFHLARAQDEVLAHIKHGRGFLGIMNAQFEQALSTSRIGVLVVGPQEIIAQVAGKVASMRVFVFKDTQMQLSHHLDPVQRSGQLRRIDVDIAKAGAWDEAYHAIREEVGLDR